METLLGLVEYVVPFIVGVLVVPVMSGLKAIPLGIGKLPAVVQQGVVVILAGLLTMAGTYLNVALPESIELFTQADVQAAMAAAFAMLIHSAKKKASEGDTPA